MVSKEFKAAMLEASASEWIRGEPGRHVLIDQISSKLGVKNDLNLYAVLEEAFQLTENDVMNINLCFNEQRVCASVLFASGFKAWEIVRQSGKFANWTMRIDSGAREFERIREEHRRADRKYDKRDDKRDGKRDDKIDGRDDKRDDRSRRSEHHRQRAGRLSCSPFVPCLRIPFSVEHSLPFKVSTEIISSIFPSERFPSFSGVEEGSSTWHVHFGREIDVIAADQMLLRDLFRWKGNEFYFERWSLMKGGQTWSIPEPGPGPGPGPEPFTVKRTTDQASEPRDNPNPTAPPASHESFGEGDYLKLPKFVRKEKRSASMAESADESDKGGVKVKVKRKPIGKKPPFAPPPMPPIKTETVPTTLGDVEIDSVPLKSGSARTEGIFALAPEERERVRFAGILEAFSSNSVNSSSTGGTGGSTFDSANTVESRSSRAQNRRPLPVASSTALLDFFKVSPLQSTQKLVALRNSSIHSYGLVLMEPADPGDLILEYVGELVRASLANIREWKYEREYKGDGIASSYLFRLDGIMVIDATHQGNLARFINHSCDPNCVAKTISLNGSKRIVMYAKKPIRPGEEITYDYKFPTEKDPRKKVRCLCGSTSCRKFLN